MSVPPPWMSAPPGRCLLTIAEHSMCQPGRPGPHGLSQVGSPGLEAFHSAKSSGLLLTLVAQGAIRREAPNGVVDVAAGFFGGVGVASFYQLRYQGDHLGDVLGGPRFDVGHPYAEHLEPLVEGIGVAAYDLLPGDPLLVGPVYDLVLYIRDVLDERHVVTPAPRVPGDYVPEEGRPRVTYVDVVVDGGTADVEVETITLPHLDHPAAHAVLYEQAHAPSLASLARSIRTLASAAPNTANRRAISGPLFLPVSASRRGCRRSLVLIPCSFAQARSPVTNSRASSTPPNSRPSSRAAACAKTSMLDSCSSSTNKAESTGSVIPRSRRGASERVLISSLKASSAAASRPHGRGSSRKGSRRRRSSSAGRRRMWLASKDRRRSGSKVAGLLPKREGSHSCEISSRSVNSSFPCGWFQPRRAR